MKPSSKASHNLEEDLNKIYNQINKQYKSITRELVDTIVRRFDDFADIYINESPLSNKEKNVLENSLLTKRILNNGEYQRYLKYVYICERV